MRRDIFRWKNALFSGKGTYGSLLPINRQGYSLLFALQKKGAPLTPPLCWHRFAVPMKEISIAIVFPLIKNDIGRP
jgi:hypothetical protein